jgi:penicillin-binding protein 2
MLIFDQLKKNDPQLRAMAVAVLVGLLVLAGGLWWVQIVSARDYQANLEMQSFRTVRIPAVRGKIVDRRGNVLAENRPTYNISLYLDELRKSFDEAASAEIGRTRTNLKQQSENEAKRLGRGLKKDEKRKFVLSLKQKAELKQQARFQVASNVVVQLSQMLRLPAPVLLNQTNFEKHYQQSLALPFPVFTNLAAAQIALFEEQCTSPMGVDLEMQSTRFYPFQTAAAHVIGSVHRDDSSAEGEDAFVSYRLPDYKGQVGVEAGYDKDLRGKAGIKSVVVNSQGYRQTENIWEPAEQGQNVVLTIDIKLQQKVEKALRIYGPGTKGAAVVMDVESGDILAMASSPTLDPNCYIQGISREEWDRISELHAEKNRATQENYEPGSIFKTVVGLACLEHGLDPNQKLWNPGHIQLNRNSRPIGDLAAPGEYDFRKALAHSSNTYFISNGLKAGIENIILLAQQLHLGERAGLQTRQESAGRLPNSQKVRGDEWHDGDTANICIGQGPISVTPLQMAVMTAAIANGGKVLWPRLIERIESQTAGALGMTNWFPAARLRDQLSVSPRNFDIVREAMVADVEPGGSGAKAAVPGLQIGGKTGTAQVTDEHNHVTGNTVWFASFGMHEKPQYAMVIMVELDRNAGTGGSTCAPIARNIYLALQERERGENTVATR